MHFVCINILIDIIGTCFPLYFCHCFRKSTIISCWYTLFMNSERKCFNGHLKILSTLTIYTEIDNLPEG